MSLNCPVCHAALHLKYKLRYNVYECPACGFLTSDATFNHSFVSDVKLGEREDGLRNLRTANFQLVIDRIKQLYGDAYTGLKGLEIGSGNGWWLYECKKQEIDCTGIEPERVYEQYHRENGLNITYGFYPEVRFDGKKFDFIIFNDVFEHIPIVNELVNAIKSDLKEGGIAIINIPLSNGLFYTVAKALAAIGQTSFLTRMWQFDFHSPHISYFNDNNINMLLTNHGFNKIAACRLDTLDFNSVKERILTDKKFNKLSAALMVPMIQLLKPLIRNAKPDTTAFFFRKA